MDRPLSGGLAPQIDNAGPIMRLPPVVVNPQPLPRRVVAATERASALGLSLSGTTVPLSRAQAQNSKRFGRMKRVVIAGSDAIQRFMQLSRHQYRVAMVTLTYRPGAEWESEDIARLMRHYRKWLHRRGIEPRYVWVMELQKRGAPHYHLLLWLPRGVTPPKPDKQGWWRKGMSNCVWARRPVGYVAKYASKGPGAGTLPHGARLYGVGGVPIRLDHCRAPGWLRRMTKLGWRVFRLPGGWWGIWELAHAWRSPWEMLRVTSDTIEIQWRGWRPGDIRPLWEIEELAA